MKKLKVLYKAPNVNAEVMEIEDSLAGMQEAVGGCIACTPITEKIDFWYNDEFLFLDFQPNIILDDTIFHGSVFFAGHDIEGNTISLNEEEIEYLKKRFISLGENPLPLFFNFSESDIDLFLFKLITKELSGIGTGDLND